MNTGIGNKVCLELIEVNIEGPVKSEAGRDGGYNLGNESVEVGVGGSFNRKVVMAEVVDCLKEVQLIKLYQDTQLSVLT